MTHSSLLFAMDCDFDVQEEQTSTQEQSPCHMDDEGIDTNSKDDCNYCIEYGCNNISSIPVSVAFLNIDIKHVLNINNKDRYPSISLNTIYHPPQS